MIYDRFSVHVRVPTPDKEPDIYGKWLVFKDNDKIDDTWEKVRTAVVNDSLQGCVHAKCPAMRYDPTKGGLGPSTTGVICVYTEKHNMDAIGFKLITIVQQDIKYKTNSDSWAGKYVHLGFKKVTIKTISGTMGDCPLYARISHAMEHPDTRRIYGILMLLRLLKNLLQKKSLEGGF